MTEANQILFAYCMGCLTTGIVWAVAKWSQK
jgi:hypothetical protein